MAQQTYEGTWEEIVVHAAQLVGKRVKLIVLDEISESRESLPTRSLAETLKGKVGIVDGASPNLSENTGKKFADIVAEKHRKQGRF